MQQLLGPLLDTIFGAMKKKCAQLHPDQTHFFEKCANKSTIDRMGTLLTWGVTVGDDVCAARKRERVFERF